jgi:predicted ester cyclase
MRTAESLKEAFPLSEAGKTIGKIAIKFEKMKNVKLLAILAFVAEVMAGCNQKSNLEFDKTLSLPATYKAEGNNKIITQTILASQKYATFWNTGKEEYALQALSANFTDRNLPEGRKQGIEGVLAASKIFRTAVPNLKAEMKELIVNNDKAVVQYQFTGNFTGKFNELQGQGQPIDFVAVDIYTVKNEKITENWHLEDNFTLLSKMGVLTIKK